jgi:hypothetical protein
MCKPSSAIHEWSTAVDLIAGTGFLRHALRAHVCIDPSVDVPVTHVFWQRGEQLGAAVLVDAVKTPGESFHVLEQERERAAGAIACVEALVHAAL